MTKYFINNGEIAISFSFIPDFETRSLMKVHHMVWNPDSKLWVGGYSPELESIARQIVASDPENANQSPVDVGPAGDSAPLGNALDQIISRALGDEGDNVEMQHAVFSQLASDPDSVVDLINSYKAEAKAIESEKDAYEDAKLALKEIQSRKKFVVSKRSALEQLVATYMKDHMLDKQRCRDYSMVLDTKRSYSLSEEFMSALIAGFNLPEWLSVEVKLNDDVLDAMERVPEGVDVVEERKFKLKKNLSETNRESLEMFNSGLSVREISERRNLSWIAVFSHLTSAMSKGELELEEYISDDMLDAIKAYHEDNPNAGTIQEYVNAFSGLVTYDIMALALKYLKIK